MRRAFRPAPCNTPKAPGRCILTSKQQNVSSCLRAGLLLLLLPEGGETDTGDLDDLETDTGNITLGLTLATETSEQDLVVLIDEVQATVIGHCYQTLVSKCVPSCVAVSISFVIPSRRPFPTRL